MPNFTPISKILEEMSVADAAADLARATKSAKAKSPRQEQAPDDEIVARVVAMITPSE